MIHEKAIEIAEQAATLLHELSRLLRSDLERKTNDHQDTSITPPKPTSQNDPEITIDTIPEVTAAGLFPPVSHMQKQEMARRIKVFWQGVSLDPVLQVGGCMIDLTTAQGRFEVLVLAVLMGARVSQRVIQETFEALKSEGLLQLDVLSKGQPNTKARVETIFRDHYRALTSKAAKVDAIFWNASHLDHNWQGDLNLIYEVHEGDATGLLQALRQFRQISRMALWICRTMYAHGIWREMEPSLTWYFDHTSNLPLRRLGYLSGDGDTQIASDIESVVTDFFDRAFLPLYLHGDVLCSLNDIDACLSRCPVASWCTYPQRT